MQAYAFSILDDLLPLVLLEFPLDLKGELLTLFHAAGELDVGAGPASGNHTQDEVIVLATLDHKLGVGGFDPRPVAVQIGRNAGVRGEGQSEEVLDGLVLNFDQEIAGARAAELGAE